MTIRQPDMSGVPLNAASNLRSTCLIAVPLGVLGAVLLALVGHPLAGAYLFLGFALGALNAILVRRSVARCLIKGRRPNFVGSALGRMAGLSLLAILIALLARPDGVATMLGLALFQVLSIVSAVLPLLRELRRA